MNNYSFIKLKLLENKELNFSSFLEYNSYLINYNIKLSILNYIEYVVLNLFKDIDIDIFKIFLNYNKSNVIFQITLNDLLKYNLITDKKERTIKQFINTQKLKINIDYKIKKIIVNKNSTIEYKFTINCLKMILLKENNEYQKYFLLLENCIFYYEEYQNILFYKLGFMKDIKLDNLTKLYENQEITINNLYKTINNMNNNNNLIYDNLNLAHEKINTLTYLVQKPVSTDNYIFSIYKIAKNKFIYINTPEDLYDFKKSELKLKYSIFNKIYTTKYNKKYIHIISKLQTYFKFKLQFFNCEIILKNLNIKELIEYIETEFNQYN